MKSIISKKSLKTIIITTALCACTLACLLLTACSGSKDADMTEDDASFESVTIDENKTYYAKIEIEEYGTIIVKLDQNAAPITVQNFVTLAESGLYDGLTFHRIIEGFMMQGGDAGVGVSLEPIVGEFAENGYENNLSHTRGAISMARTPDYNSATSQFFIVHEDSTYLDGQYAAFGYVTEGIEVVDKICEESQPTDNNGSIADSERPVIKTITIYTEE